MWVRYFLISFVLTVGMISIWLLFSKKIRNGQVIRKLGPERHLVKSGIPTMGGLFLIFASIITFVIYLKVTNKEISHDKNIIVMLIMPLILYGALGFSDDYLKVKLNSSEGLSPKSKIVYQIIWASIYFLLFLSVEDTVIKIGTFSWNAHWLYGFLILLMFCSGSNAYNLTDGLDGLATGIAIIILSGILFITYDKNIPTVSTFIVILLGALFAFLIFNFHPAKIFMGDSGSMAIGAILASLFIILKLEYLFVVFGFVLVVEALSVIMQVCFFKVTKGKRLFKMTPLHHHFELKGIKEEKVVFIFWLIQIIVTILGLIIYRSLK